jgi:hypothetical protein
LVALHHVDEVGPVEVGLGEAAGCLGVDAGGPDLEARVVAIKPLGRDAALLVHRADEENFEAGRHGGDRLS